MDSLSLRCLDTCCFPCQTVARCSETVDYCIVKQRQSLVMSLGSRKVSRVLPEVLPRCKLYSVPTNTEDQIAVRALAVSDEAPYFTGSHRHQRSTMRRKRDSTDAVYTRFVWVWSGLTQEIYIALKNIASQQKRAIVPSRFRSIFHVVHPPNVPCIPHCLSTLWLSYSPPVPENSPAAAVWFGLELVRRWPPRQPSCLSTCQASCSRQLFSLSHRAKRVSCTLSQSGTRILTTSHFTVFLKLIRSKLW